MIFHQDESMIPGYETGLDPCRQLWAAVLSSFIEDVLRYKSIHGIKLLLLELDNPWVATICEYAGVEHCSFKAKLERMALKRIETLVRGIHG